MRQRRGSSPPRQLTARRGSRFGTLAFPARLRQPFSRGTHLGRTSICFYFIEKARFVNPALFTRKWIKIHSLSCKKESPTRFPVDLQTVGKLYTSKKPRRVFRLGRRKMNQIRFFRGHVPRKKHFSAQKCASAFRRECAHWAASPLSAKPLGFVDSLKTDGISRRSFLCFSALQPVLTPRPAHRARPHRSRGSPPGACPAPRACSAARSPRPHPGRACHRHSAPRSNRRPGGRGPPRGCR